MNDLDDRLTDLLDRAAAAVAVRPDIDAVIDDDVVVDRDGRRRPRRAAFALVAAAVLVVAALAAVALAATDDTPEGVTDAPPAPNLRFPFLDGLPPGVDGPVVAREGQGTAVQMALVDPEIPSVRAVVATSSGLLGDWEDAVVVEAYGTSIPDEVEGFEAATLAGRPALVGGGERGEMVIVPGEATIVATGGAGAVATVTALLAAGMAARPGPGGPTLVIDRDAAAEADLEVLLRPTAAEPQPEVELAVGPEGGDLATVETGGEPVEAGLARRFGSWVQVEVGPGQGGSAAERDGTAQVAWTDDSDVGVPTAERTVVRVTVRGTIDDALALAARVRLVSETVWRRIYPEGVAVDPTSTVPDASALIGQPAPAIAGSFADVRPFTPPQDQGEWTVLSFVASWCVPCGTQLDLLADHVAEHPDGPGLPVTLVVDDEPATAEPFLADHDVDWPVLYATSAQVAPWRIGEVPPAIVVIDPEGIVRMHLGGLSEPGELAELLAEVGAS
jgi:peroxiredoxin